MRIARVRASLPASTASSRRSLVNHWRILVRAREEPTKASQSCDGPADERVVKISTTSPLDSLLSSETSEPFTRAPVQWWPTSVCTA